MLNFINHLLFALSVTGPIFFLLMSGIVLKRINWIDQNFMDTGSKIVFKFTLPVLIFMGISRVDLSHFNGSHLIFFVLVGNLVVFLLLCLLGKLFIADDINRQGFIHGGYRANAAIIGLSYINNAFGEEGLAIGSLLTGFIIILYNILAVILLTPKGGSANKKDKTIKFAKNVFTNPLIVGSLCGILFSLSGLHLPLVLSKTGNMIASITLPMALICTGGTLNFRQLHDKAGLTWATTAAKLIFAPTIMAIGAYFFGFSKLEIGVIFLLSASPAAIVSYIMAKTMSGDAILAANIIATTSLGSVFTCSFGLTLLSVMDII